MNKTLATVLVLAASVVFMGCTKNGSTVNPIQSVGCAVETAAVGGAASAVAGVLQCTNQSAIQASLTTALGNVNLCNTPVTSAASIAALAASAPKFSKIGDVTAGDLAGAKSSGGDVKAQVAKPQGIIGNIACPIVVNTVIGFGTSAVPSAWGCSTSASADSLASALSAACEAAVPL